MATFAQAKARTNPTGSGKPLKLSVGHDQVLDVVSIDYDSLRGHQWVMTVLNGKQFGFQIHHHPLNLADPHGLIIWFVDDHGKPVATEPSDVDSDAGLPARDAIQDGSYAEDMSIMEGDAVIETLKQYIGEGNITLIDGKYPPRVRIVTAPINPAVLG